MSRLGKIGFGVGGLFAIILVVAQIIIGVWLPWMWGFLAIAGAALLFSFITQWRTIFEFLTMKTTRSGLSMGAVIGLTLAALICVNIIAVKRDKKFDMTNEGMFTLSDQSIKAARDIREDVKFVVLYRRSDDRSDEGLRRNLSQKIALYTSANSKITYEEHDVLKRVDLAKKFEFSFGNSGIFLQMGEKTSRVDKGNLTPTEEDITNALIGLTRTNKKNIYFVKGHEEREVDTSDENGLSELKKSLESAYNVKGLELFKEAKVPDDAEIVAIIGAKRAYLEGEIKMLETYLERGGKMLIALDPGQKHGLIGFMSKLGVNYKNNYIIDPRVSIPGAGNVVALGSQFSQENNITKDFRQLPAVFLLSSALGKDAQTAGLTLEPLVSTDAMALSVNELTNQPKPSGQGPFVLGYFVKGKLSEKAQEFNAVVYGSSSFMQNAFLPQYINRDLAVNSLAKLAKDENLISIRPKQAQSTKLEMTNSQFRSFAIFFLLGLPVLLFLSAGVVWYKRRNA